MHYRHSTGLAAVVVTSLAGGGCPRATDTGGAEAPVMVVEGDETPAIPGDFEPGPPLGEPPPPDPMQPGLEYLSALAGHIEPAWASFLETARLRLPPDHPVNRPDAELTLDLALGGGGELESVRVTASSGVEELEQAALEVVRDGAPYPAPPDAWVSDDDRVHVRWRFARDQRQAGVAGATLRRLELPVAEAVPRLLSRGNLPAAARRVERAAADAGPELVAALDRVAVAALEVVVRGDDPEGAVLAIDAAAAAGAGELLPAIREIAGSSVAPRPRQAALRALGALGDRSAVPLLVAAVEGGPTPEDAASAAAALVALGAAGEIADQAAGALGDAEASRRWRALATLSKAPSASGVAPLTELLEASGDGARAERLAAAAALGPASVTSGRALAALRGCLERGDAALRAACAEAIADAAGRGLSSRITYWKVVELLRHPDERVRAAAVRAAARLEPGRFGGDVGVLRSGDSALVQRALAEALTGTPGDAAVRRLAALAGAEDVAVRQAAARALGPRSEPQARRALLALLSDPAPEVRAAALAGAETAEAIEPHLADEALVVRVAALGRLAAVRGRPAVVGEAARRIADASDGVERALWAGAWLARR